MANWFVYIIKCSDGSLYTGITTDIERRFLQHKTGKGAKYFRRCQPVEVVYREEGLNKSEASKRELFIKSLDKASKLTLIDLG